MLISAVSPIAGVRRAAARNALERMTRGYDAADTRRNAHSARQNAAGPIAAGVSSTGPLRNIARDLCRNNGIAANAVNQFVGHVVGTGIVPRFEATTKSARDRARSVFGEWVENCEPEGRENFYGQQGVACAARFRDGDALRLWRYDGDKGPRCEIVEIDYLDTQKNELARDGSGKRLVHGIEYSAQGERLAYWLHDQHPGEVGLIGGNWSSRRIDARFVDHIYRRQRPGQSMGVSAFAPVIRALKQYQELNEALLDRRQLEAFIGLVVKQSGNSAQMPQALTGQKAAADGGQPIEEFSSGMVQYLRDGEDFDSVQISSAGDSYEFGVMILHGVSAGLGLPYHMLTSDVSKTNYTSLRATKMNFHVTLDIEQRIVMQHQFCRPAWTRVRDWEILKRGTKGGNLDQVRVVWTPPARAVVDPKKDIEALIMEMEALLKSPQDAIQQLGRDPEETMLEIAAFQKLKENLGLLKAETKLEEAA